MTVDRDQHGYTRAQLDDALKQPDDEPNERLDPPADDTTEDRPMTSFGTIADAFEQDTPQDAALDLVRADGLRHYHRASDLLAKAEMTVESPRRRELIERCHHHTELAKAAALLTGS